MKFVCDRMLGTLARWMRLFGFDVQYPEEMSDKELAELAHAEGGILLTRDKMLAAGKQDVLLIKSDVWEEQYAQVSKKFDLRIDNPMSRCSLCNEPINEVTKQDVEGRIPERVYERQDEFWHCPKCDKYYWKGTHWDGIMEKGRKLGG